MILTDNDSTRLARWVEFVFLRERIVFLVIVFSTLFNSPDLFGQCDGPEYPDRMSYWHFATNKIGIGMFRNHLMWTTDGGYAWHTASHADTATITRPVAMILHMFDTLNALAITDAGQVFKSSDGGRIWHFKSICPLTGLRLYPNFCDSRNGYVVSAGGRDRLFRTVDGGETWTLQRNGGLLNLAQISMVDSLSAYVIADYSFLLRTTNAGVSWTTVIPPSNMFTVAVKFQDTLHGLVIGRGHADNIQRVYKTTDGGITWQYAARLGSADHIPGVQFIDNNRGLTFSDSLLIATTDFGKTWHFENFSGVRLQQVQYAKDGSMVIQKAYVDFNELNLTSISSTDCFAAINSVQPLNGSRRQPLEFGTYSSRRLTFKWDYERNVHAVQSLFQLSFDSTFKTIEADTTILHPSTGNNPEVRMSNIFPGKRYFWRVALQYLNGEVGNWSPTWEFTTAVSGISGSVFGDLNQNSNCDSIEVNLPGEMVGIAGKVNALLFTDATGHFAFEGLDSGVYRIFIPPALSLQQTFPLNPDSYYVSLRADSVQGYLNFGVYRPWNSISGYAFQDDNENGLKDSLEQGIAGWDVTLTGSGGSKMVRTGFEGDFAFRYLSNGTYILTAEQRQYWNSVPSSDGNEEGLTIVMSNINQHWTGQNFAFHPSEPKVKLPIEVIEYATNSRRKLWFGTREGATPAIWGVDFQGSAIDYSEGEFEIPPRTPGYFDVRFEDPKSGIARYGAGSWTDMRPFLSSAQIDTYKIVLQATIQSEEALPLTLRWSSTDVARMYQGDVWFRFPDGWTVSLKEQDSLVVPYAEPITIRFFASQPLLPPLGVEPQSLDELPASFGLQQNYPDPFNPMTEIRYQISEVSRVTLKVYDVLGREVATLVNESKMPGTYSVRWDARDHPSGLYFCRMQATRWNHQTFSATTKMLLIK